MKVDFEYLGKEFRVDFVHDDIKRLIHLSSRTWGSIHCQR
jgi:hypothetical protein